MFSKAISVRVFESRDCVEKDKTTMIYKLHNIITGMKHFCSLYGNDIYEMQKQSGPPIRLEGATLDRIQEGLEESIPLDDIEAKRKWRDDKLVELFKLKNKKS